MENQIWNFEGGKIIKGQTNDICLIYDQSGNPDNYTAQIIATELNVLEAENKRLKQRNEILEGFAKLLQVEVKSDGVLLLLPITQIKEVDNDKIIENTTTPNQLIDEQELLEEEITPYLVWEMKQPLANLASMNLSERIIKFREDQNNI